ncbi:MAG: ribosome-associated translation inhibitor RaiA [Caldiserica bacterium]|jgi:putative sigma-54 modulation protein|nr:ribosome-associated translation inhibitor RaiA [Caldisericota bacterium]MDH7562875.1 ribosome-associated translation inhibitor RaiA [Caldisericota bacterium]
MRIIVKGKNVDLTEALHQYAIKKVQRVDRYFNNIQDVLVTLSMERGRFSAEATMQVSGALIRAEEKDSDMYSAIDRMADKLERQVKRHKERLTRKGKATSQGERAVPSFEGEGIALEEPRVVKTKRFALKPMNPEEAVEQLELLGHSFFVFLNAESNRVNVVYKREDGNYGLIEPEME